MQENKYPIGGYAPGNYFCHCVTCKNQFQGDKRAVQCESCALEQKKRFDALSPEEQEKMMQDTIKTVAEFFEQLRRNKESHANADYTNLTHDESNYIRDKDGNIIAQKR